MTKIETFISNIECIDSNQAKTVRNKISILSVEQKGNLERGLSFIEHYFNNFGKCQKDIAIAWNNIVKILIREKYYFFKHQEYRCKTLDEAVKYVYNNNELMFDYNIWLLLSNLINYNHILLFEFFKKNLIMYSGDKYLEIGPGHGLFFNDAINTNNYKEYIGIDISKTSLNMSHQLLSYNNISKSYKLDEINLFDIPEDIKYHFITCGEVLEHVENPTRMIKKIYDLLSYEGRAYISTAINSPAPDHIYLFRKTKDVENILENCGFEILEKIETSLEEPDSEKYSELTDVSVGYIIRKSRNAI